MINTVDQRHSRINTAISIICNDYKNGKKTFPLKYIAKTINNGQFFLNYDHIISTMNFNDADDSDDNNEMCVKLYKSVITSINNTLNPKLLKEIGCMFVKQEYIDRDPKHKYWYRLENDIFKVFAIKRNHIIYDNNSDNNNLSDNWYMKDEKKIIEFIVCFFKRNDFSYEEITKFVGDYIADDVLHAKKNTPNVTYNNDYKKLYLELLKKYERLKNDSAHEYERSHNKIFKYEKRIMELEEEVDALKLAIARE